MANVLIVDDHAEVVELSSALLEIGTPYFVAKGTDDYAKQLLAMLELALRERHAPAAA